MKKLKMCIIFNFEYIKFFVFILKYFLDINRSLLFTSVENNISKILW